MHYENRLVGWIEMILMFEIADDAAIALCLHENWLKLQNINF